MSLLYSLARAVATLISNHASRLGRRLPRTLRSVPRPVSDLPSLPASAVLVRPPTPAAFPPHTPFLAALSDRSVRGRPLFSSRKSLLLLACKITGTCTHS